MSPVPPRSPNLILGFAIPYLPDALAGSLHLSADRAPDQLAEVLARQANLVAGLHRWQGAGFSLRYIFHPGERNISIGLLVRLPPDLTRDGAAVEKFAAQLHHYFGTHEVPLTPLSETDALERLIRPFPFRGIADVRQRVQVIHMPKEPFFVVFPYSDLPSSWIPVMRMLMAQESPVMLSSFLQPTVLLNVEEQVFANTATEAQSKAQQNFEGQAIRLAISNPQAEIVSKAYSGYLTRLQQPFLSILQIAAADADLCGPLAQAIGGEVSPSARHGDAATPSGFDVMIPADAGELAAARRVLETLSLSDGSFERIDPPAHKERLQFLCDARTAAATFRFPVSIRGGVPGIATRQHAPSQLGPQRSGDEAVTLGTVQGGQEKVTVDPEYFKRHTLIAGINGSGKTTTCFQILFELHRMGIPFLVIEPAKHEYRALLRAHFGDRLRVYTLGDANTSPFMLNPLELLPGVKVEGHISKILACLLSALPLIGPLPSLLEASLFRVYAQRGWGTTDVASPGDPREMPTLRDLYMAVIHATEDRGYSSSTLSDIQAASAGRLVSFLRGSKGRMLDTPRSTPMADIVGRPTVLELDSLSDEEKALVMLFLVTHLREHLATTRTAGHLQHVTLIEEAHRVMAKPEHGGNREISAATSSGAVALMSAALSEVRAYGEGIIIAEQVPGRLVEDALKNTNTKIVHRLPGSDDRAAVGDTMNLEEAQETYLAKLGPGQIAYFGEGLERPIFVDVHDVRREHNLPERVTDTEVASHMAAVAGGSTTAAALPYSGCAHCRAQCRYRDTVSLVAFEVPMVNRFSATYRRAKAEIRPDPLRAAWNDLAAFSLAAMSGLRGDPKDADRAWCLFSHLCPDTLSPRSAALFFEMAATEPPEFIKAPDPAPSDAEQVVAKAREVLKGLL